MELQINALSVPSVGWNKEEFKAAITALNARYAGTVVVDKALAKQDRAAVNKAIKAVDAARKEVKKKLLAPYTAFESELNEIMRPLKDTEAAIAQQLSEIEQREREEKEIAVRELFAGMDKPEGMTLVIAPAWLNASTSMTKVKQGISEQIDAVRGVLEYISKTARPYADTLRQMALQGAPLQAVVTKDAELQAAFEAASRVTAKIETPETPEEIVEKLKAENPQNTYTPTENGIEVKAKIKEHKLTVMCSDGKFDMLLSWLDREGYFFMTED